MTPADLTAKAQRAAEWLKARDTVLYCPEFRKGRQVGWLIQALNTGVYFERTDREFIAFCEDRGWQDQEQEADGVEWGMKTEAASYGELVLVVERFDDRWEWKVQEIFGDVLYPASGTASTRDEARASAVEAARALGK